LIAAAARLAAAMMVVAWSLSPFLWQLLTSLKPDGEIGVLPPLLPSQPTLEHYVSIFTGYPLLRIIVNSTVVATLTTLGATGMGALAGFALAKLRVRHRRAVLAGVVAISMLPPIAIVSPLFLAINAAGLRDTLTALVITYTGFSLPFAVWLMTNFFRGIPDEVYVAARVDGCSALGAFWKVMLPLAAPGIAATALLVFISAWNEFLFALSFTSTPAARTLPVAIALFPGLHEIPWGEIAAATVVATLPLVLLSIVFQRRIGEGLSAGAVKG
jgi:multiple sugar transport system permease protein